MDKRTIAVIFGGCSPEYPVSLEGSNAVISNLDREKYDLVLLASQRGASGTAITAALRASKTTPGAPESASPRAYPPTARCTVS